MATALGHLGALSGLTTVTVEAALSWAMRPACAEAQHDTSIAV